MKGYRLWWMTVVPTGYLKSYPTMKQEAQSFAAEQSA